jgi:hypothetical protein
MLCQSPLYQKYKFMKNTMKYVFQKPLTVAALFGVTTMLVHAQESATLATPVTSASTSVVPHSPESLRAIKKYSDTQLTQLVNALAATPLTWPTNMPKTKGNLPLPGAYWSLAHPDWPPLPSPMGMPFWNLSTNAGSSVSPASSTSSGISGASLSLSAPVSSSPTDTTAAGITAPTSFFLLDDVDYSPSPNTVTPDAPIFQPTLSLTTNDLWLEIVGATNTDAGITAGLIIHPPWNLPNNIWDIFATTNLANAWQWVFRTAAGPTNIILTGLAYPNEFFTAALDDGTGLSPDWEMFYFGHTGVDPNADPTGDGLTNYQKYMAGLNPNVPDNYQVLLTEPPFNSILP